MCLEAGPGVLASTCSESYSEYSRAKAQPHFQTGAAMWSQNTRLRVHCCMHHREEAHGVAPTGAVSGAASAAAASAGGAALEG